MKRIWTAALLTGLLTLLLSGCIFRTPDELYQLPARSPGYEKLTEKIDEVKHNLELEFATTVEPAVIYSGDNTSTIQFQDMDSDGTPETAVTFLRVPGADMPLRIYFFTLQPDESYQVSCIVEGTGTAIYKVDYVELSGEGQKELVVSWQTSTNVYQLGVYSLDSSRREREARMDMEQSADGALRPVEATELLMTTYSGYSLLDIDQDLRTELAVIRVESADTNNLVEVYGWRDGAFVSVGTARLSTGITARSRVRSNFVADSIRALYITGTLMDGSQATDIVAWRDGELVNLTLNPETGISNETLSGYGSIGPSDVNDDTVLEMPQPIILPSYPSGEPNNLYLIEWSQYDINGASKKVFTTYHNYEDSWYLEIPDNWVGQITIGRNDSVSEERAVIFYHWNGMEEEPTPFMAIYKLSGVSRTVRATRGNRFILSEDDSTIYAATFLDSKWDCGLEEVDVLNRFHRILSGWASE